MSKFKHSLAVNLGYNAAIFVQRSDPKANLVFKLKISDAMPHCKIMSVVILGGNEFGLTET